MSGLTHPVGDTRHAITDLLPVVGGLGQTAGQATLSSALPVFLIHITLHTHQLWLILCKRIFRGLVFIILLKLNASPYVKKPPRNGSLTLLLIFQK